MIRGSSIRVGGHRKSVGNFDELSVALMPGSVLNFGNAGPDPNAVDLEQATKRTRGSIG